MSFDVRCPECKAKLRLDEAPDADTPIECPRCGSQFDAPKESAPAPKPEKKASKPSGKGGKKGKKKIAGGPKKRKAKKKKTNPVFLLMAIGAGFAGLIAVGFLMVWFLNRAGKVEEMLTYVPDSCNWARGINVSQLSKYPGYQPEVEKFYTTPVKSATDEVAKAANQDPDLFVDYLVIAKNRAENGTTTTMYVVRTQSSMKLGEVGKNLPGAIDQGDGSFKMPAKSSGILSGAYVYFATPRLFVIVPPGPNQQSLLAGATAGKAGKSGSFAATLDTTGRTVIRGSIWLLIRSTGGMKNYISSTTATVNEGFKNVDDKGKTSPTFGVWTTPGGSGVRVGAAMQMVSSAEAKELVKSLRDGPLGKGDESEPPHQFKSAFNVASDKKAFGEFMQYLEFKTRGDCAFITSTVSGDNAKRFMDIFNSPTMGTGESSSGGMGPMIGPGVGVGGGGPGPAQPGLPGGVITPGIGPGR